MNDIREYKGCLIGGAIGDALGAPIEFQPLSSIRQHYGLQGIIGFVELNPQGQAEFTDDTQMTLFTAEGLLVAQAELAGLEIPTATSAIYSAYLRWLLTQSAPFRSGSKENTTWLLAQNGLWKRKAPGNTCLSALASGKMGEPDHPINSSKGCGGVMRVAPIGLAAGPEKAFQLGCAAAAITHGHPSGFLAAGCLAQMIAEIIAGRSLLDAVASAILSVQKVPGHQETLAFLQRAVQMALDPSCRATPETVEKLGGGWVAEEALAISVYCALVGSGERSFQKGVLLAVNHSGDSDSTGAISGNLLGALLGIQAVPDEWIDKIEMRHVLSEIAAHLFKARQSGENWREKTIG